MDIFSILKDIFLVVLGGIITFYVTILVSKYQECKPDIFWKILPPISFPSKDITSYSLVIENTGNKDANNIRASIILPNNATVEHFDIQLNKAATKYESSQSNNKFLLDFPVFYKDLECVLSFFTKKLSSDDIQKIKVSIVGLDISGKSMEDYRNDVRNQIEKKFKKLKILILFFQGFCFFGLISLIVMSIIIPIYVWSMSM